MPTFLDFAERPGTGKTKVFAVYNKTKSYLGHISWYGPWRKYVFTPADNCLFDASCLSDVVKFMNGLMTERRNERREAKQICVI
jgi:hypothetical protein